MRRLLPLAVALVAVVGCAGSGSDTASPTTAERSTTTTDPPTTTTTVVQVPQATAAAAVDSVMAAWRAGDRRAALVVADVDAVDALFAIAPEAGQRHSCNRPGANVRITCGFRLTVGELTVRASPRGDGFIIDQVILGS